MGGRLQATRTPRVNRTAPGVLFGVLLVVSAFVSLLNLDDPNLPIAEASEAVGTSYFVDPAGDDANVGTTETDPWATMAYAVSQLSAGDTLYVRGGRYEESDIEIGVAGTPASPITIVNYPGEQPVLDGSFAEFRQPGNTAWELADAGKQIYRSVATYPGLGQAYGYFGGDNGSWRLVPYEDSGPFWTNNESYTDQPPYYYIGPGVFWDPVDERIYYRSQQSINQVGYDVPSNPDPRQTSLYVFGDRDMFTFSPSAANIVVSGLTLQYQNTPIHIEAGAHHITVLDIDLLGGRYHILARDGSHDLVFDTITIADTFPPWVSWTDVKRPAIGRPGHLLQGAGINLAGNVYNVEVANSTFVGLMDGVDATDNPSNVRIHDSTFDVRDDAFKLGSAAWNIEFDHNTTLRAASAGPSWSGSGSPPPGMEGTVYVHHNILDSSQPLRFGRQDPLNLLDDKFDGPNGDGFTTGRAFGSHTTEDVTGPAPWKIYHNTVIGDADLNNRGAGSAYRYLPFDPATPHEVYNNIFVQLGDQWIVRDARVADGSQIHDGNLYWAPGRDVSTELFNRVDDTGTLTDFQSLTEFMGSAAWQSTLAYYAPGWESSGVEADPRLDADLRPPTGSAAATGAVDLSGKGWPGISGETFRGARSANTVPGVSLEVVDGSALEGSQPTDTATVMFSRSGGSTEALVVSYQVDGSATNGTDFDHLSGTVTIPTGSPSVNLTIVPIDDGDNEGTETVSITVLDTTEAVWQGVGSAEVTIVDDEQTLLRSIAASTDDAEESVTGSVKITSSDLELTEDGSRGEQQIGLRFTDIAIPRGSRIDGAFLQFQADESTTVPTSLVIKGEAVDDAVTFSGTNGDISGRTRTTSQVAWNPLPWTAGDSGTAQRTPDLSEVVQDLVNRPGWVEGNAVAFLLEGTGKRVAEAFDGSQPPQLQIAFTRAVAVLATDDQAQEGTPVDSGQLTFTRTGPVGQPLTVSYGVSGTAEAGLDYAALDGTVIIPANAASTTLDVTPLTDSLSEGPETVIVTVVDGVGYVAGVPATATVTIADAGTPSVSVASVDDVAVEGAQPADNGQFVFTRSGSTEQPLEVTYSTGGSAVNGVDYQLLTGSVTIPAGLASIVVDLIPLEDTETEVTESVVVTVVETGAHTAGDPGEALVHLVDNEVEIVRRVAASAGDAEEAPDGAVSLSGSSLEIVEDGPFNQTVGLWFGDIDVPRGATVTLATIQFQSADPATGAASLTIRAEAADNATVFSGNAFDISSRPTTTAAVSWSPPDWLDDRLAGLDQQTPDLSTVIQEIVDRPGWNRGGGLVVAISGTGSANPVVRQDQAGIILSVTPRISPDEVIVMEVSAEKSQFTGQGVPLFTDANTGNVIESPVKDVITASTTISVPNGQTVVLGGMITSLDDVTERKVPWLGDLPVIGRAFRHDIAKKRRTELLIFLTPRVIHNTLDSEMIKQVEAARLHYVESAAEEVHGPLFGIPAETGYLSPESPTIVPEVSIENLELRSPPNPAPSVPRLADPEQP